ncbi:MAG: hypothetical protein GEU81_10525 [Nitriliruptorales bacterium]|nr:hypothetical protein [Nitriliruptorales bacterium]
MTATVTSRTHPPAAAVVGWLSLLGAIGTALLSVSHMGVEVPLLAGLGPGGTRAVPVAAVGFAVAAVLYAGIAFGAFRQASWAWTAGLVLNALAVLSGLGNFRGAASATGIVIGVLTLIVLISPGGRQALRRRR